ncbi:hypothetical protein SAMN05216191_104248 [Paenibacillus jilunlii]|uniref:Uncharacterized protein n=1 Tax=Paenibacillus jilunlii TaxID=682956 RepID=A0A1G9LTV1_9BACL|nr:hypothetical protein SAMN05216191_104248 [Paenibacillus jilunlii]
MSYKEIYDPMFNCYIRMKNTKSIKVHIRE